MTPEDQNSQSCGDRVPASQTDLSILSIAISHGLLFKRLSKTCPWSLAQAAEEYETYDLNVNKIVRVRLYLVHVADFRG